jgi:SAM-dependent methyltransferase
MLQTLHRDTIPRYRWLAAEFGDRPFRILDAGCGNHAPTETKHYFPKCDYSGIDLSPDYNNDEADIRAMTHFWEMDMTRLEFKPIPDSYFDAVVMNHVIEHLRNGDEVMAGLVPKLKPGGIIYVEFPGPRSLKMPGLLNFHHDSTHVRVFSSAELAEVLRRNGCEVMAAGTRRVWLRVLMTPVTMAYHKIKRGRFLSGALWDLTGFAEYVVGRRRG